MKAIMPFIMPKPTKPEEYKLAHYKYCEPERVQQGIAIPKNTFHPSEEDEEWERKLYENPASLSESLAGTNVFGRVNNIRPRW